MELKLNEKLYHRCMQQDARFNSCYTQRCLWFFLIKSFKNFKTIKKLSIMTTFHAQSDEKWMKYPEFQMFSNFAFEKDTVYVTKDWLLKNADLSDSIIDELEDSEVYETMLSIQGFHNIEHGVYGVEIEEGKVQFGDTSKTFQILINGNWIKTIPKDHMGYYKAAK